MRRLVVALAALAVVALAAFWVLTMPRTLAQGDLPSRAGDPARGEYVFAMGGCASCHMAPGSDDRAHLAGGQAFRTEFGTFYAPNVSPDPGAGIGGWTVLQFVNAVMRGVSPGGAHYYPAFPYTSYRLMKVEDVVDLKAYMDTLPAVAEPAPAHDVPFPFNVRRGLGLWKLLYFDDSGFTPDPALDEAQNRGRYLVEGPGHCNECHTPRSRLGGLDYSRRLSGAPNPEGKGRIPNITAGEGGIGSWSADDIAYALESGFTPDFDSLGGSMTKVVANTSRLTAEDRQAIAAYLKAVPPLPSSQ